MAQLKDKVALVTGASGGMGRATANLLGAAGARVSLVARRRERLDEVAMEVEQAGGRAQVIVADLKEEAEIITAAAQTAAYWGGRIDILINSAGVARQSLLSEGDTQDWRDMWQVNVLALAVLSRESLRFMNPETGGHIVNLCSMSGHRVPGKGGFYAATKFAVRAMTEGLRQELRAQDNPTKVSQISPGFVETELLDEYLQSGTGSGVSGPGYPVLQPEDMAATILHVLTAPPHVDVTDVLVRPTGQKT